MGRELEKKVKQIIKYNMARKAKGPGYTLRSGKSPLFKNMGSSPAKYTSSLTGEELNPHASGVIENMQAMGVSPDAIKPTKSKLSDFFSSLGKKGTEKRQEKQVRENQGMTNFEKKMADKAAQRKSGGKSKFQRAGAERKANKAATAAGNARNSAENGGVENIKPAARERIIVPPREFAGKKGDKFKYRSKYGSKRIEDSYEFKRPGSETWETPKTKEGSRAIHRLNLEQQVKDSTPKKEVKKTKINTDPVIDIDQNNISDFFQGTTSYHTTDPSETYKDFVPNKPKTVTTNKSDKKVVKTKKGFDFNKTNDYSPKITDEFNNPIFKKSPSKKRGYKMKRK